MFNMNKKLKIIYIVKPNLPDLQLEVNRYLMESSFYQLYGNLVVIDNNIKFECVQAITYSDN